MGPLTLAVDSGEHTGWAKAVRAEIVSCGLCVVREDAPLAMPVVIGGKVWVEFPKHYPEGRNVKDSKWVDPNDLIKLGSRAGRVQERYLSLGNEVHLIFPYQWKGQLPKRISHERIQKKLTPTEARMVATVTRGMAEKKILDVWDALGILIWALEKDGIR